VFAVRNNAWLQDYVMNTGGSRLSINKERKKVKGRKKKEPKKLTDKRGARESGETNINKKRGMKEENKKINK
jgi:hypothetical protein